MTLDNILGHLRLLNRDERLIPGDGAIRLPKDHKWKKLRRRPSENVFLPALADPNNKEPIYLPLAAWMQRVKLNKKEYTNVRRYSTYTATSRRRGGARWAVLTADADGTRRPPSSTLERVDKHQDGHGVGLLQRIAVGELVGFYHDMGATGGAVLVCIVDEIVCSENEKDTLAVAILKPVVRMQDFAGNNPVISECHYSQYGEGRLGEQMIAFGKRLRMAAATPTSIYDQYSDLFGSLDDFTGSDVYNWSGATHIQNCAVGDIRGYMTLAIPKWHSLRRERSLPILPIWRFQAPIMATHHLSDTGVTVILRVPGSHAIRVEITSSNITTLIRQCAWLVSSWRNPGTRRFENHTNHKPYPETIEDLRRVVADMHRSSSYYFVRG